MRILLLAMVFTLVQCSTFFHRSSQGPQSRDTASSKMVLDQSGYLYDPQDKSCDGYPRVMVETMPGTCLGMVLPRSRALDAETQKGFVKPRTIVQLPGTAQFLVVDMGGWTPKNGRLFLLKPSSKGVYEIKLLKAALDNPHGLALGPDGFYYIGEKTQISKFHIVNGQVTDWKLVIGNLVRKEGYMHPLSQFVFDPRNGDLYINSGSPSDHCVVQGTGNYKSCPEEYAQGNGAIYRIPGEHLKNIPAGGIKYYEVAAQGLRNSMAMAISNSGFLIQGENSRDFPEPEEPYEEINVVDLDNGRGFHYGWPYCYDQQATSPEWLFPENKNLEIHKQFKKPVDCAQKNPQSPGEYQAPWALMPPHVAPLHMAYYKGSMFSDLLGGKLLVTWHGYQPSGQRLVAYNVDDKGRPLLKAADKFAAFDSNQKVGCPTKKAFQPHGGMDRHAPYTEVISKWNEVKNRRPKGAPVAFTEAEDGSLWIVEDRENRTILRLARTQNATYQESCEKDASNSIDPQVSLLAWRSAIRSNPGLDQGYRQVQTELIQKYCLGCHGNLQTTDIATDRFSNLDFLVKNEWIVPKNLEKSKAYGAIARLEGYTPMPPLDKPQFYGTPEGERLNKIVSQWLQSLPTDIEQSYARFTMSVKRNVRAQPGTSAKSCGQLMVGDIVYIDPRPATIVTNEGYKWNRVYLVPSHSRLFKDTCVAPEDGVYYIAR
ncbi:PQQ-dependent sugar dehydrogenase [Bdellovibrio sp. HCB337]|uniref:PQQ-dependent sugar dehydrogenase n=1 Tax=Bdellovibrio sp. HCB337 TaxID=3394358 RepID=UPI0039A73B04